jgi:prepilin-type N-terminal cleavage/methylation domain-containing protein
VRGGEHIVLSRLRAARRPNGEQGFTLIEIMIATSIMLVVLGMLFSTLVSLTKSEDRAQRLVSNEQNVRFEIDQLAREIRAANPLVILDSTTTYSSQIEMVLGPTGGTQTVVRWTYDTDPASPKYEQLSRQLMSDSSDTATVLATSWYLIRVRNVEKGTPLFTYYDANEQDMVADGNYTNSDIANCSIRVHISLSSDSNPGPLPFTETQDVELRNRLPGGTGCPLK